MTNIHRNIAILFSLLAVVIIVGSVMGLYTIWPRDEQSDAITVYVSVPLSLSTGKGIANGVGLAIEEANQRMDRPITLVVRDDGDETGAWVGEKEDANARAAANDPTTVAYIGTFNSGAAKISMPILNTAGIAQVSPGNTWPGLTKPGFLPGEPGIFYPTGIRHYFRVCPTDDLQGPAGARWAKELGFTDVYILDDGDSYGKGIADIFSSWSEEFELNVVGRTTINPEEDYRALADFIIAKKPDLIYYGGITPNGITDFLTVLRAKESDIALMGPDGIVEQDFIDRSTAVLAEGVYATTVGISPEKVDTEKMRSFRANYRTRYGIEPEVMSAFGYEAATVVIAAIERNAMPTRDNVLAAIRGIDSFNGLFGPWSFDQNGDTSLSLVSGNIVRNGVFESTGILPVPR